MERRPHPARGAARRRAGPGGPRAPWRSSAGGGRGRGSRGGERRAPSPRSVLARGASRLPLPRGGGRGAGGGEGRAAPGARRRLVRAATAAVRGRGAERSRSEPRGARRAPRAEGRATVGRGKGRARSVRGQLLSLSFLAASDAAGTLPVPLSCLPLASGYRSGCSRAQEDRAGAAGAPLSRGAAPGPRLPPQGNGGGGGSAAASFFLRRRNAAPPHWLFGV